MSGMKKRVTLRFGNWIMADSSISFSRSPASTLPAMSRARARGARR